MARRIGILSTVLMVALSMFVIVSSFGLLSGVHVEDFRMVLSVVTLVMVAVFLAGAALILGGGNA